MSIFGTSLSLRAHQLIGALNCNPDSIGNFYTANCFNFLRLWLQLQNLPLHNYQLTTTVEEVIK